MNIDYLIVGLGKTGFSCVRYLQQQGFNIAVADDRANPPYLLELQQEYPQIPVFLGEFLPQVFASAKHLVVSPGVSLQTPAITGSVTSKVEVLGDIELFARVCNAPIVAITGSNGKSTVTTLVAKMAENVGLNVKVGANLGEPALDLLQEHVDLYVLELSSFQLDTTKSLQAEAAVVLNISRDHLDRYANFAEYKRSKLHIYHGCKCAIYNRQADYALKNSSKIGFGLDKPGVNQFGLEREVLCYGKQQLLPVSALKIKGRHQVANALAALALGKALNLPLDSMVATLKAFSGLPHRCQFVRSINGVNWYNDSKGTNVGATAAAIQGLGAELSGKLILLAGGLGKGADFTELTNPVAKYVRAVVVFGEDGPLIAKALQNETLVLRVNSLYEAIMLAKQQATSGDAVLLSPACASFDMFANFEHRGNEFMRIVKDL